MAGKERGNLMSVLERILEEIEKVEEEYCNGEHSPMFCMGACSMAAEVKEIIRSHMDVGKDTKAPTNDWIPVSDRLPEDGEKVIVWYEYFRYGEYNCMFQTYGIGWQYDRHWSGDVSGTKARCIAWQPLPEQYKGDCDEKRKI